MGYYPEHNSSSTYTSKDFGMIKTVYYLRHSSTHELCSRYYMTLAGARIAQRSRNARLGYKTRQARTVEADLEFEQCLNSEGTVVLATWAIEEDWIESVDLTTTTGPAADD